jgi:hypothetical protein
VREGGGGIRDESKKDDGWEQGSEEGEKSFPTLLSREGGEVKGGERMDKTLLSQHYLLIFCCQTSACELLSRNN